MLCVKLIFLKNEHFCMNQELPSMLIMARKMIQPFSDQSESRIQ